MNNIPTPSRQRMRQLVATYFLTNLSRRNNTASMMEVTCRYGHTVYTISAYGNPASAQTYEERLLNLIQHEAEKLNSHKETNSNSTTNNDQN